ncbi:MAG: nucleoside diphosphate kinase regulator [Kiritimatiellae bacterium]|jgi:regulator of nucleoside diphosphate kinase|nr:nucleoside diphosphate kinase regulator [Kiritimatiellia bacterium]NLD89087.1 nucleoside diphosphate kinase regulator [Lentisphaerota bacterium]HPC18859.1 nucleoside diphosphate kinase regulator [Kiritimatiellia bacterium]HQN80409.1 nucleoside diphosphate kinase regulator [Kiritimatiellia bacterium]HQQ61134.1 nucleoside diphosphate kinase regulator [Kiritimatiellia bacterium]
MSTRKIYITATDRQRLNNMLESALAAENRDKTFLKELARELANAETVDPKSVPPHVVTMNSRVVVKDVASGETSEYTLVFPEQADVAQNRLSVVSPIGTAILGYAKGDTITWQTPGGPRQIRILDIPYQPEAAGDFHL